MDSSWRMMIEVKHLKAVKQSMRYVSPAQSLKDVWLHAGMEPEKTLHRLLLDLEPSQCRYIEGDHFCPHRHLSGKSFCAHHDAEAHRKTLFRNRIPDGPEKPLRRYPFPQSQAIQQKIWEKNVLNMVQAPRASDQEAVYSLMQDVEEILKTPVWTSV